MIHQHHYRLHNTIHILLKTRSLFYYSCSFCLFCLRSTNAIMRRHWLLASVSIASVLLEHHLFVYVRHIWSAIVWGAPSSRKKGIKRLEHQKIYSVFCMCGSGSGLSGPFSEVAVKMPMEYWLPFGLVLLFQILCIKASPFMISYFAL